MACALHPDGGCPMQKMADHLTNVLPAGLNVVAIVMEPTPQTDAYHASIATRTGGDIDVADLLRSFADDIDQGTASQVARAVRAPGVGRIRADAPPATVRRHLEEAVARGANTVVMDPRALLRLMNASMS